MTDQMIIRAYDAMTPLPGGEERMWQKIEQKLDERDRKAQVRFGARRSPVPALLAAALILAVVLLVAVLSVSRYRLNRRPDPVPAATPVPEEQAETMFRPEGREIRLINARVNGESSLRLVEEGRFLARAVLPDGMAVDYWLVNGEPADAGDRRFSLEFDSEGVDMVEAVLREELTVRCGENAYLQFLDEKGEAAGVKFDSIGFEYDYTVPLTGESHPGGTVTVMALPVIPLECELDYWLIDGKKVEAEKAARGILLEEMDHSVTIDAVVKKGWHLIPDGVILMLQGEGGAALVGPSDDLPANQSTAPGNSPWENTDILKAGVPFDPTLPAPDGHMHQWEFEKNLGISDGSGNRGGNMYVCTECRWEYISELFPTGGSRIRLLSAEPIQQTEEDPDHNWVRVPGTAEGDCLHEGPCLLRCADCGAEKTVMAFGDHAYTYYCVTVDENGGGCHKKYCYLCHKQFDEEEPHVWTVSMKTNGHVYCCVFCGATYGYTEYGVTHADNDDISP